MKLLKIMARLIHQIQIGVVAPQPTVEVVYFTLENGDGITLENNDLVKTESS